jgi:guanylate kinase
METGKLIIFSAPSGSGKSSIIQHLLRQGLPLQFSISATSRAPRGNEQHGVDYYFLTPEKFRSHIEKGDFLEYEEVYKDNFYGTLKSEVERITDAGKHVVFDVDVVGGCRIKTFYGDRALSIFIQPPSIDELRRRLEKRGTDTPETIENRLKKATYELSYAPEFDVIIVNDELAAAQDKVLQTVRDFIVTPTH